jgi:rhamnosyltransferase subunit B
VAQILIVTKGTAGDVVPFLEIGAALRRRGNGVLLLTHSHYGSVAQQLELPFEPLDTPAQFGAFVNDGPLLDTPAGFLTFADRHIFPRVKAEVELLERHCRVPGAVVLTRHMSSFAASIVCERHTVPLATAFASAAQASGFELWIEFCRSMLSDRINGIRQAMELPDVTDWRDWLTRSALFLACWPDWFSPATSSWPKNTRHIGFLHSDVAESGEVPARIERMLESSPAPVLITGGTSMWRLAQRFYSVSAAACQAIGRPAILVCRHDALVPLSLPSGVWHCRQLPFATVMPRVAAVIHHGGAGTMIRAAVSGTPQLVLPFGADRPENAARMQALGIGAYVGPGGWEPIHVSQVLAALISSSSTRCALADLRGRISSRVGLEDACAAIEELGVKSSLSRPLRTGTAETQAGIPQGFNS